MLLTEEDAQRQRTPSELHQFALQLRTAVRKDAVEFEAGMKRRGLYKKFLDEIEPLSEFALLDIREDCYVAPVLGHQGPDAVVNSGDGQVIDKIELAKPFDGAAAAKESRKVLCVGHGALSFNDPGHEADVLLPILERTARSKAIKDYSDATLVFILPPLPHYASYEDQYNAQLQRLRDAISKHRFRAKRVLMFVPPSRLERVDASQVTPDK